MAIHDIYQDACEGTDKDYEVVGAKGENMCFWKEVDPTQGGQNRGQNAQEQLLPGVSQLIRLVEPLNTILAANNMPLLSDNVSDHDILAAIKIIHR